MPFTETSKWQPPDDKGEAPPWAAGSLNWAIAQFLYGDGGISNRTMHTIDQYRSALTHYAVICRELDLDTDSDPLNGLPVNFLEDSVVKFLAFMTTPRPDEKGAKKTGKRNKKGEPSKPRFSLSTQRVYLAALQGFLRFVHAEGIASVDMVRIEQRIYARRIRPPQNEAPSFQQDLIEQVIEFALTLNTAKSRLGRRDATDKDDKPKRARRLSKSLRLANLRDRALVLTLADTGLRIHEACALTCDGIDLAKRQAKVLGKGGKKADVRFSERAVAAINDYLEARYTLDHATGRPLEQLPVFARHDPGAVMAIENKDGTKSKRWEAEPISTTTGRNIVANVVAEALKHETRQRRDKITPHTFRHYFVTRVVRQTRNLRYAQKLARHSSLQMTQRYSHLADEELNQTYNRIFNPPDNDEENGE